MLYEFDHTHLHRIALPVSEGPSDEILLARIRSGDEAALEALLCRHRALLRTIFSRVVHNDADVDDLLQEVFCEIWRLAAHYDEAKGKALGWIVTLARRRAIDRLRKKQAYQRAQDRLLDETKAEPEPAMHHGADAEAIAADRNALLHAVLSRLPAAQHDALQLAFFRGMSQREIAAHTGVPLGTIKTRLELALRKVRAGILALGGTREWSFAEA